MVAYCATTLQGATCVNSRCPYNHDVIHCELCGRSFPASLLAQHQSAQLHLRNVAANVSPAPSTPRSPPTPSTPRSPPPSQSSFSDLLSAPTANTYRLPGRRTPAPDADPRVNVSDEGGLYFVVDGTGSADNPSFPSKSHTLVIERASVTYSLTVESMKLIPSPNKCFVASLLGKTLDVRKGSPRKVEVLFKPPRAGTFQGTLKITFRDKARRDEKFTEFTVTRELHGHATLPTPASSSEPSNKADGDGMESEHAGVTVSHGLGVEFSVERSRSDEPFDKLKKELVIKKNSVIPLVSFKEARVSSEDKSGASWFSARFEGDSQWIKYEHQNTVTVRFTPQREGLYEAVLELIFCDHKHETDFVIKRTLSGRAKQPGSRRRPIILEYTPNIASQPINDRVDDDPRILVDEEFLDCDGTGVTVSHADGLDFGIVERKGPNEPFATPSSLLTIKLEDDFPAVKFIEGRTKATDGSNPHFEVVFEGSSHDIQPGSQRIVRVIFNPKYEGLFKATLELIFYHTQISVWFVVRRTLQGIAGSLKDHNHFESLGRMDSLGTIKSRATRPQKTVLLLSPNRRRRSRYLPDYGLPPIVQEALDKSSDTQSYDENAPGLISALRPDSLYMGTYAYYFNALLAVEDGHQQWDVKRQPTYNVDDQGRDHLYGIEIENNDEDLLPEVSLGDFLWLDDIHDNIRYEARVTDVDVFVRRHIAVLKVSLRLPTDFNLCKGSKFELQFRHNRSTLRRQYHALTAALAPPRRLLFPSVSDIKPLRRLSRDEIDNLKFRQLVNRDIRDDGQQLQAVISILEQPPGAVPFIVYGPPGTGKTSTVVESVVQLVRRDAGVRVLVCTPSNAAADLLAERLAAVGLDSDKLYHLDAPSLYEEDILEDLQTSSLFPGHERLLAFRVVLSTCSSASMLRALDVPVGHFSHIVIDEAAQAEEPLAMIPIMGFSNAYTNIILAGDPNQLGPIIKSPTAARAGLGKSYLERLMLMDEVYGLDASVGKAIVGLHRNHRSHGNIIAWSNRYLYEDTMRDYGNSYITYHLVLSDVLPKKGFPIVFHGVKGNEQHAKWSPSYFNIIEASIVRDYCVKLIGDRERKIYPEEIGVVAPYGIQVRAIRELLRVAKLSDIFVGTVEQFQGQERKVIILAATRSNEEGHSGNGVGFLMNPQRTNVAITRAQALLIVVGDPDVLGKDKFWHTFLGYVESRKGWTGKMHNWKPEDVVRYEVVPGKAVVAHGEEFIGGKSEKIRRSSECNGG